MTIRSPFRAILPGLVISLCSLSAAAEDEAVLELRTGDVVCIGYDAESHTCV